MSAKSPTRRRTDSGGMGKFGSQPRQYKMQESSSSNWVKPGIAVGAVMLLAWMLLSGPSINDGALVARRADFQIASWNIAAINNNPFEYWITHDDAAYNKMMIDVQDFIESPGDKDVKVNEVFTDVMFNELIEEMRRLKWDGLVETKAKWKNEFRDRKIISEFMKDGTLGDKRLASMPDRTTNTILTEDGPVYRPTVINCYIGDLSSQRLWWSQWKTFMFDSTVKLVQKDGSVVQKPVSDLLIPIKRAKYKAVTEEEEKISIPLQGMCGAIFDAILVYIVNQVSPNKWQNLRGEMCAALNLKKTAHTLEIIEKTYASVDVFFLQEVAKQFIETARNSIGLKQFEIISPDTLGSRDQNSVIFLRKSSFDISSIKHHTDAVWDLFEGKSVPVATGDILSITVNDNNGVSYMLSSFHGDTNGLATIPVVSAVENVWHALGHESRFVFGLDANTYEHATPGKTQDVLEFAETYVKLGLTSVWGDRPDPTNHTTYNARTFLQPQLNKAARKNELVAKGDVNPKDFVLFHPAVFSVKQLWKDNTGKKEYTEGMVFPTLVFPSDHGVLSADLTKKS